MPVPPPTPYYRPSFFYRRPLMQNENVATSFRKTFACTRPRAFQTNREQINESTRKENMTSCCNDPSAEGKQTGEKKVLTQIKQFPHNASPHSGKKKPRSVMRAQDSRPCTIAPSPTPHPLSPHLTRCRTRRTPPLIAPSVANITVSEVHRRDRVGGPVVFVPQRWVASMPAGALRRDSVTPPVDAVELR